MGQTTWVGGRNIWIHGSGDEAFVSLSFQNSMSNLLLFLSVIIQTSRFRNSSVADDYRRLFRSLADSADMATFSAGYEYIRVDVYVPLLDLPDPVRPSRREREKKGLSQVVIQGYMQMQSDRRNYEGVLKDLGASMKGVCLYCTFPVIQVLIAWAWFDYVDDPHAWGYLPLESSPSAVYKPDPTSALDPFVLHLAGSGSIEVPPALRDVVRLHIDLEYEEYYDLIHGMDLCIPAFAEDSCMPFSELMSVSSKLICVLRLHSTGQFDIRHGSSMQRTYPFLPYCILSSTLTYMDTYH